MRECKFVELSLRLLMVWTIMFRPVTPLDESSGHYERLQKQEKSHHCVISERETYGIKQINMWNTKRRAEVGLEKATAPIMTRGSRRLTLKPNSKNWRGFGMVHASLHHDLETFTLHQKLGINWCPLTGSLRPLQTRAFRFELDPQTKRSGATYFGHLFFSPFWERELIVIFGPYELRWHLSSTPSTTFVRWTRGSR